MVAHTRERLLSAGSVERTKRKLAATATFLPPVASLRLSARLTSPVVMLPSLSTDARRMSLYGGNIVPAEDELLFSAEHHGGDLRVFIQA